MGIDGKQLTNSTVADGKLVETYVNSDGSVSMTAALPMGSQKITGLADGTAATDAATKGQLDAAIAGLTWVDPVTSFDFIGERTITQIDALSPSSGWSVVSTDAGTPTAGTSDLLAAGDLAEFDGTSWIKLVSGATGQLPAGVRLVASTTAALFAPLTDSTDDGKILVSVADPGTINGSASDFEDSGDSTDGNAVLVQGPPTNDAESVDENKGYVFNGTVPTGSWVQFTGAGTVNPGAGLTAAGATLNVGDANKGVQVNADDLEIDGSEMVASAGGLQENSTNSWQLEIKLDTTTGGGVSGLRVAADGLGVDDTLAGNGLSLTDGSAMAVELDTTTGGGVSGLRVSSAGLGVDDTLAGNGLSLTDGSAMTLQLDTTTGGGISGLRLSSAGLGVDDTLAGNGLSLTDGSAMAVQAANTSVSVSGSGVQAAVPTANNKNMTASVTSSDGDQATATTVTAASAAGGWFTLSVNGVSVDIRSGSKLGEAYISGDSGSTARTFANVAATDTIHWNGSVAGYQLAATDRLDLDYTVA
jgi:hypothetical protein